MTTTMKTAGEISDTVLDVSKGAKIVRDTERALSHQPIEVQRSAKVFVCALVKFVSGS